jgi:subtilisin-like proprotein convertase family protein
MPAATHNFSIEQGSDNQIIFEYFDENNSAVDLRNYHIVMSVVTNTGSLLSFNNFTKTNNYSFVGTPNGRMILDLPAKTTNEYTFNSAVYDLDVQEPNEQFTGSGFKRYRFSQGSINIIKRNTTIQQFDIVAPITDHLNRCSIDCSSLDTVVYNGPRVSIPDNNKVSSTIPVSDPRPIKSIDVAINGLYHANPQDLTIFLVPPSGNKVLLMAHNKIFNYRPGFSFMFSDMAPDNVYINNVENGGVCRILNRTNRVRYDDGSVNSSSSNNEILSSSFNHLINYVPIIGNWSLDVYDNDTGSSGVIDSWNLIIHYQDNT